MPGGLNIDDLLLFYGGISFLAMFYWFISFIYSKKRNYLILMLATATGAIYYLGEFGIIPQFKKVELIFLGVLVLTYYLLASELNRFRKNLSSFVFRFYTVVATSLVTLQLLTPLFFYGQNAVTISHLLTMPGILVVMILFAHLWLKKRQQTARFAFWGYLPSMVGYIIFAFSQIKILPSELSIMGPVGATVFLFILFYGMVTYTIALRKKRENEHLEKEEWVQKQNILLVQKVEERTHELEIEKRRSEELLIKASQRQMAELELQSLRARLNPHFMFNSLNAIQEMILKGDFESSHTYLARFAKLLRTLLENTEMPFTSLQREVDFLELYLSLEKLRIPDLQISITTDPSINKAETFIPNMILQPYIENALWHGLSHKTGDRKLELKIQKENGRVVCEVKDNGVGRKKSQELKSPNRKQHKSKGNELLTKRLKLLSDEFGSDIKAEVSDIINNGKAGGTKVSIVIPDLLIENFKNLLS